MFPLVIIIVGPCPRDVNEHVSPEAVDEAFHVDKGHNPAILLK